LKREDPARTVAQVCQVLAVAVGWAPNPRTIQRHFQRVGMTRASLAAGKKVAFGRFEASRPNELWVGDALHGPIFGAHKAILFAFLDDHVRHEAPCNRVGMEGPHRRAVAAARLKLGAA
jgi:putative transposase